MAPRKKPTLEDQADAFQQQLSSFQQDLKASLREAIQEALTTVLQHQHAPPPTDATSVTDSSDDPTDNPWAQQGRNNLRRDERDAGETRWEASFKMDIPEFLGTLQPEEFLDWLSFVEEVLDFKRVPEDMRTSLVATKFRGRASAWWQQFKAARQNSGKPKLCSWEKLKKHMRRTFLPYNYERTLYTKLQNLRQGSKTVEDYATEFFQTLAHVSLTETEDQLVSRFLGGLRPQLQVPLQQFNPNSVSEAYQRALSMELQIRPPWNTGGSRQRFSPTTELPAVVTTDLVPSNRATSSRPPLPPENLNTSRPSRPNALRCYSCGEPGHRQTACPNAKRRGLLLDDADVDHEAKYDDYGDDPPADIEDAFGDKGPLLVLRRSCFLPRSSQEPWLRSNLFRSTCTVNGKICRLVIDSGSCVNAISDEAVRHIILGRPWQYDHATIHHGRDNTYTFVFANRTITLHPSPENYDLASAVPPPPNVVAPPKQPLLLLSKAAFEEQLCKTSTIFALIQQPASVAPLMEVPESFRPLLDDFQDVFPQDLPLG
ncbi:unnamed protein product [Microthlaspi erraticum]|uniref:CCHC-type domain-containing protein n=1 Tax=Microthlaspi erraticum TaxID=1685480 RepID=A0A6D2KJ66_9BRAS|nr:unnamed protein product [Microthlaspi erraticum]CAA7053235.1 unnamed protein product [Microthlaspi erraticum]